MDQAVEKQLTLITEVDPVLDEHYFGAADRIQQVLLNLVGNAIKFTDKGIVMVSVKPDGGNIRFSVTDTGIGISPDRLEKIFDPFTQADPSITRRFGGTGLGTSISKQLIELMGGTISVTSEPGMGSCFEFTVPLKKYEEQTFSTP
jgi:signal transduction histidine kinase